MAYTFNWMKTIKCQSKLLRIQVSLLAGSRRGTGEGKVLHNSILLKCQTNRYCNHKYSFLKWDTFNWVEIIHSFVHTLSYCGGCSVLNIEMITLCVDFVVTITRLPAWMMSSLYFYVVMQWRLLGGNCLTLEKTLIKYSCRLWCANFIVFYLHSERVLWAVLCGGPGISFLTRVRMCISRRYVTQADIECNRLRLKPLTNRIYMQTRDRNVLRRDQFSRSAAPY